MLNKIRIYGISIPIWLVFVRFLINSSYAQCSDDYRKYTNDVMNFTIQHPLNWQVKENTESPRERVWVELSGRILPIFAVDTEKLEPHLDSNTMILKNTSLEQPVQQEIDEMSSVFRNFDLIRQYKVTIGGNGGWKMEFAGQDSFYLFEICTIS